MLAPRLALGPRQILRPGSFAFQMRVAVAWRVCFAEHGRRRSRPGTGRGPRLNRGQGSFRSGDRPRPRCKANSMQGSSRYWPSRGASLIILGSCVKILFFSQDQFFGLIYHGQECLTTCAKEAAQNVCVFVYLFVC